MTDPRKLAGAERIVSVGRFRGERARDRVEALRQVEGLNQGDAMVALLADLAQGQQVLIREQQRTNQLLEWLGQQPR